MRQRWSYKTHQFTGEKRNLSRWVPRTQKAVMVRNIMKALTDVLYGGEAMVWEITATKGLADDDTR